MPILAVELILAVIGFVQLSPTQKQQDFLHLARLFNKQYGQYEWKNDLSGLMPSGPHSALQIHHR